MACKAALSFTSARTAMCPAPGSAATKASAAPAERRNPTATEKPAAARALAVAAPMPPVPPVTTATGLSGRIAQRFALSIAAHAQIGLLLVAGESLQVAEARTVAANQRAGFIGGYALIGTGLDELAHPQAARIARRAHGRQGVIRADDLVPEGHIGARP